MSALIRWLLSTWVARKLQNKKTYVFAGSLFLLSVDHFAGTRFATDLVAGGDLTNGQAMVSGLVGLALTALKAGLKRQDQEVRDMLTTLIEAAQKAKNAAPALLAAALLVGCSATNGVELGNKLAGMKLNGSLGFNDGGAVQVGATLVGQQGGVSLELNPVGGNGTIALSANIGLCDALRALGMEGPTSLCKAPK